TVANYRELSGWGEIAQYLGVSPRTAQAYEQEHRLPVHRRPGSKGRVWAIADELDVWKGAGPPANELRPVSAAATPGSGVESIALATKFPLSLILSFGGLAIATIVAAALWLFHVRSETISDFRIQGRTLIALDSKGEEAWRYVFPAALL